MPTQASKLCPLLIISGAKHFACREDGCEWYYKGHCAVRTIALELESVKREMPRK